MCSVSLDKFIVSMPNVSKKMLIGWLSMSSVFVVSTHVHADALLDFTLFKPPVLDQRKITEPIVNWLVRADAQNYCEHAAPKDGFHSRADGCAYWYVQTSSCTIVTTSSTTHSQLGHLFLRCIQGQ
jgi:hypothetical protein